ncbi:MAG: hypothetical protein AAGJ38_03945 [Planctomycetota bacterium]
MKPTLILIAAAVFAFTVGAESPGLERSGKSQVEQQQFLEKRTRSSIRGRFGSFTSLLYAIHDVAIHTESDRINDARLHSPFPEFYRPTWAELFGSIARQTRSAWTYDPERDYWVFAEPAVPPSFELALAEGWRTEDRGIYVFHAPEGLPVGMDIYMLGRYSPRAGEDPGELYAQVREAIALRFARGCCVEVEVDDMQRVEFGEEEALYFETAETPRGVIWRQWSVVVDGHAFLICSAMDPEHADHVRPDVDAMIATFRLVRQVEKSSAVR